MKTCYGLCVVLGQVDDSCLSRSMETTCCVQTTSAEEKGLIYEELKEQYHLVLDVECMNLL